MWVFNQLKSFCFSICKKETFFINCTRAYRKAFNHRLVTFALSSVRAISVDLTHKVIAFIGIHSRFFRSRQDYVCLCGDNNITKGVNPMLLTTRWLMVMTGSGEGGPAAGGLPQKLLLPKSPSSPSTHFPLPISTKFFRTIHV